MMTFSKKSLYFPIFWWRGRSNIFRGVQLFPGVGSNCLFLYKPKELVIYHGVGSGIVNCVCPHIMLATRRSMTLTP